MDNFDRTTTARREASRKRRVILLWMLSKEELAVSQIADRLGISRENISCYLRQLEKSGLVTARRAGRTVYYHVVDHEPLRPPLAAVGACD